MKLSFKLFIILFSFSVNSISQDLINPYQVFGGQSVPVNDEFRYPPLTGYNAPNPNGFLFTPAARWPFNSTMYNGEYMIILQDFPWFIMPAFRSLAKSYKIEAMSFPFTVPCWDTESPAVPNYYGCATPCYGTQAERTLLMPDDAYNSSSYKWGNLSRVVYDYFIGTYPWKSNVTTLVSQTFIICNFNATSPTAYLPHTALKQTIYLHCSSSNSSDIIDSVSFIYDNTRGKMRDYPFYDQNINQGCASCYDVVFRPEILVDPDFTNGNPYDISIINSNAGWFDGGSLNYFPFDEINSQCGGFAPTINDVYAYSYSSNPYNPSELRVDDYLFVFPPPFSLLSASLKDYSGKYPAGYELNTQTNALQQILGIRHAYKIDQNIDINILSPNERIVYNPSEVEITEDADDLHFPSYYTFKTVRGVYPTLAEVAASDILENGGPYSDLRDVPVRTDLRTDVTGYPNDPAIADHSVYASIYHLKPGSKLTLENCVRIFDAYFEVEEGATMIFTDHSQIKGLEDKSINSGRYKVTGTGGAILRNYDGTQYVQNGTITQPFPLEYIALSEIHAGENVDPDTDQPVGIYDVQPGADVTFKTAGFVHLANGFQTTGGNFHAFTIPVAEMNIPVPCNDEQFQGGGGERVALNSKHKYGNSPIRIYPNPASNQISITSPQTKSSKMVTLIISDIMGKQVYHHQQPVFSGITSADISIIPAGIYSLQVIGEKSQSSSKLIKQ